VLFEIQFYLIRFRFCHLGIRRCCR